MRGKFVSGEYGATCYIYGATRYIYGATRYRYGATRYRYGATRYIYGATRYRYDTPYTANTREMKTQNGRWYTNPNPECILQVSFQSSHLLRRI